MLNSVGGRLQVVLMAVALSFGAGVAAGEASSAPWKWWLAAESRAAVGISDKQSARIERIFASMVGDLRAEKAELERQEQELSRLLAADGTDEAVVIRAIDRVEAARSALAKTRTLMLYRMRRVLSPEQRVRLDDYHKQQERSAGDSRHDKQF